MGTEGSETGTRLHLGVCQEPPSEAWNNGRRRQDEEPLGEAADRTAAYGWYRHGQEPGERDLGQLQRRRLCTLSSSAAAADDGDIECMHRQYEEERRQQRL